MSLTCVMSCWLHSQADCGCSACIYDYKSLLQMSVGTQRMHVRGQRK